MINEAFFFFQAEDGIRDYKVTGVQTCALPILRGSPLAGARPPGAARVPPAGTAARSRPASRRGHRGGAGNAPVRGGGGGDERDGDLRVCRGQRTGGQLGPGARRAVKTVLVAAAFLTRVPVPVAASAADVGAAAQWFPLVGAALGGAAVAIAWVMTDVLGVPSMLAAALLVGLGAWVTGALHLDGLADMADGFGGGRTREDVLRIMREPANGSYGATAVAIVIAIKVTAVAALLDRDGSLPFLVAAPVISRWSISPLAAYLPYARAVGGLGQAVTRDGHTARLL